MVKGLKKNCPQKIKVLFFISSLAGGGAERVMVDVLRQIDKERIEPVLVLLHPSERSPYRDYFPGEVKVIVVKRKMDNLPAKISQFIRFAQVVRKEKPHVLLSMLTHNNIMAIAAGMILRIKVIVSEHVTLGEIMKTGQGRRMLGFPMAFLVKVLYRFAGKVVAVSEGVRTDLMESFHIPASRIRVIYNPVDVHRITGLSGAPLEHPFFEGRVPLVIAVGRLVRAKGFDILLKAFSRVIQRMNARLIVVGDGPEREPLERLAKDLMMEGNVSFTGFQSNPYAYVSRADVLVLSSRVEGLPMVILEAMACGTAVLSSGCKSGPSEILQNGRCGLLVPVENEIALSEGIGRLLKDGVLREGFSRLGKERAMDFSLTKIIKQYESLIYETACGKGTPG